jgi:hypothetical protein
MHALRIGRRPECCVPPLRRFGGFAALLTDERLGARVVDRVHHGVDVGRCLVDGVRAREHPVRPQFAGFEQGPHLARVARRGQFRREPPEARADVVDVAFEHRERAVVAGCIDGLRQVDDDGALRRDEHVVLGEIAVDQARAQHARDLVHHEGVVRARGLRREIHFAEARGRMAFRIRDQFHHQHAIEETERFRHAHAGIGEAIERIDLGVLPGFFLLPAPVSRALGDRARLAAAAHLAAFLVLRARLETALAHVLVDLRATDLAARAHHVHGRFLATLERTDDFIDDAIVDERLQAVRCLHGHPGNGRDRNA